MLFPIGDDNPRERTPWVTWSILGLNILAFLAWCFPEEQLVRSIPIYALDPSDARWTDPSFLKTVLTSMFMHAGVAHIFGNMLFLWIFGDNVEDKLGHATFTIFYVLAGVSAAATQVLTSGPGGPPMVGASGAVSGVLGAYVVFFPQQPIRTLLFYMVMHVPAVAWIGLWFAGQIFLAASPGETGVAYAAHIGGFVFGAAIGVGWRAVFPSSFGAGEAPRGIPTEFRHAPRGPVRGVQAPLPTIPDTSIRFVEEGPTTWALLRASPELDHVQQIGTLVGPALGQDPAAVRERVRRTRGLIARRLDKLTAERLRWMLHKSGIEAIAVAEVDAHRPPRPTTPDRVAWNDRRLTVVSGHQVANIPWSAPFLVLAARVSGTEVVDLFVTPTLAIRLHRRTPMERTEGFLSTMSRASLDHFAADLLRYRRGTLLNDGVGVLAHHGRWGWLDFADPADYEDYVFWAYNLLMARRPVLKT